MPGERRRQMGWNQENDIILDRKRVKGKDASNCVAEWIDSIVVTKKFEFYMLVTSNVGEN